MADDPPALEQHHCDAGANFVRIVLRPDARAGSVNAYRKIDLTTEPGATTKCLPDDANRGDRVDLSKARCFDSASITCRDSKS